MVASVTSFKVGTLELLDGVKYRLYGDAVYALNAGANYQEVIIDRPGTTPWWVRKQVQPKTVPLQVILLRGDPAQRKLDYDSFLSALRPLSDATLVDVTWVEFGIKRKVSVAALEVAGSTWYQRAVASLVIPDPFAEQSFPGWVIGTNGVAAYYRLGEASGSVMYDYLGGTYTGSYYGSPTFGVTGGLAGDADTAITLGGAAYGRSSATFALSTTECSLEAWIKTTDSTASRRTILGHAAAGAPYMASLTKESGTPSKVTLRVPVTTDYSSVITSVTSTKTINDGAWHHVVGTILKGSGVQLYVDGVLDQKATHLLTAWSPGSGYAQVGGMNAADYWNGSLDDVALYSRALSDGEVAQHYAAGITAL